MEREKSLFKSWVEPRAENAAGIVKSCAAGMCFSLVRGSIPVRTGLLCFGVALLAQIASNFANDYFDFKKGADREDRLGPERAVAQGWITPKAMLAGTFVMLGLACLSGLLLICFAGLAADMVGLAIAICVLAYSAGPFSFGL